MPITHFNIFCEEYGNQNAWEVATLVNTATSPQNITFGNANNLLTILNVGFSNNAIKETQTTLFYKLSPTGRQILPGVLHDK